MIVALQHD